MSEELNNDDVVPSEAEALPTEETESEIIPEIANAEPVNFEITEGVEEAEWTEGESKDDAETAESVPENKLPDVNKGVVKFRNKKEPEVDQALVDKAVQKITEITSTHLSNMILEVGQYLIKEFFDGDLELARKKKGKKVESLHQVIQQIVQSGEKDYSKSWMYNSINLVLESKALESFHSYGKLSTSCKVLLLPIKDEKIKKELIEKTVKEKLSVSKLRDLIKKKKTDKKNFASFLKQVKSVREKKVDKIFEKYNVIKISDEEYEQIKEIIKHQIAKYQDIQLTIGVTISKYQEISRELEKQVSEGRADGI